MAPRIRLDSCPPCYDLVTGTSMAAPHVSGLIALLWSFWPELSAEEIRRAILETALSDSFTGPTPNDVWGYGKLNATGAYGALRMLDEKGKNPMSVKFDFEMNPQPRGNSTAGMRIQIEVKNGNSVEITGSSNGEEFEGILALTQKQPGTERLESTGSYGGGTKKLEGGDECYINGVWYNPCPIQFPKKPKSNS